MKFRSDRWPRQYAQDILRMRTREERAAALQTVPGHLRQIVEAHVINGFRLRKFREATPPVSALR